MLNYLYFCFFEKICGKETMIKGLNRCIAMFDYVGYVFQVLLTESGSVSIALFVTATDVSVNWQVQVMI